jgi:hypothetical protein
MARKEHKSKSGQDVSIRFGYLYFGGVEEYLIEDGRFVSMIEDKYIKSIRVVSLSSEWVESVWIPGVDNVSASIDLQMTLRKEIRSDKAYWYAYRKVGGKQYKRYVGMSDQITSRKLVDIARSMPNAKQ